MQNTPETVTTIAAKAAPPVGVISALFAGITVPDVIQWFTAIYVVLTVIHKAYHMWRDFKGRPAGRAPEDELL
ncbi:hypothetical protein [Undibacterium sp.]|uniref:hypothetical protein n=1 Tax=Undibacterium sp. TaxID=1914977 RepID=UPI00374D78F0